MQTEQRDIVLTDSLFSVHTGFFCGVLLLICTFYFPNVHADENNFSIFKAPGELVDIGTHRLHINCKGNGTPTVIIDSGMGGFSLEWKNVQDSLAKSFTTCTYDRAGYGWSDPGPSPRTTEQIAGELYKLIQKKELPGPYILVGHSFGGYNMRYFASHHSEIVAGLVLVDSSHPEQFERMDLKPVKRKQSQRPNSISYTISRPIMHVNYPRDVKNLAYHLLTTQKSHMARMDELEHFETSATQVLRSAPIPNIPLVVLSRGKRVWPLNELGDKRERVWEQLQGELSYLSNISIQITATNSGHSIHLDQPELVSNVIMNTVAASQQIEEKKLASLMNGPDGTITTAAASLYGYFDIPMNNSTIGGRHNYHKLQTVYYDATTALVKLDR